MNIIQASNATQPKTKNVRSVSIALAVILVVMVVAQLFTFEKFPDVIASMWLPGGDASDYIYAAIIVCLEVLALPFLLAMRLSLAMRCMSMVSGWLVVAFWLLVSLWENLTINIIGNGGFLGATVSLPVGWWSVFFGVALAILAGWASWGMWPLSRHSEK